MAALYDSVILVLLILVFIGFVLLQKEPPVPPIIRPRIKEKFQSGGSGSGSAPTSVRTTEVAAANATICNLQPQFDRLQCSAYFTTNGSKPSTASQQNSLTSYTGAGNYTSTTTGGSALTLPSVSIRGSITSLQTVVSVSGGDPTAFINANDMLYFGYIIDVQGPYIVASVSSTSITLSKKYVGPNLTDAILSIVSGNAGNAAEITSIYEQSNGSSSSSSVIRGTLSAGTSYVSINNTNLADNLSIGDLIYIDGPCNQYDTNDAIYPNTHCQTVACNANEVDLLNNTCQIYNCVSPADTYNNDGTCTSATQYMPCLNNGVFDPVNKVCLQTMAPDSSTGLLGKIYTLGIWGRTVDISGVQYDPDVIALNVSNRLSNNEPRRRHAEITRAVNVSYTPGVKAQPYVYNVTTQGVKGAIYTKRPYTYPLYRYPKLIGPFYVASNPTVDKILIRSKTSGDLDANGKFLTITPRDPPLQALDSTTMVNNKIPFVGRDNIFIKKVAYNTITTSGSYGVKTSLNKQIIGCSPGTYGNSCTKCYPGQTTTTVGSKMCTNCPVNTTSIAGGQCTPCGANLYASPGDPICKPCTTQVLGGICDSPGYIVGSMGLTRGINIYENLTNSGASARLASLVRRLPAGFPGPNWFQYISFATSNSIVVNPSWVAFVYLWDNTYGPTAQATFNRLKLDLTQYVGTTTVPTTTYYILLFKQSEISYTNGAPSLVSAGSATPLPLAVCPSGYCCDGGKYSTYDSDVCTPCATGTVSAYGASVCVPNCPANQYITTSGCIACNANTTSVSGGTCTTCPNNQTSVAGGPCTPCPNNYTSVGGLACTACPNNNQSTGGQACTLCPAGLTSVSGTGCVTCTAGQTSVSGQGCTNCPAGQYSPLPGSPSCSQCPPGKVSASSGSVSCTSCTPGTYSPGNVSSCSLCSAGKSSGYGAASCTDCPTNYFSVAGGACTACVTNTYSSSGSTFCKPCYSTTSALANIGYTINGIAFDSNNNAYISDSSHRIRMITPAGAVSVIAGTGTAGYQDGPGTSAMFNNPNGLTLDANNNIYVADSGNSVIRKIFASSWVVSTIAGTPQTQGNQNGTPGQFTLPVGIVINKQTNMIYITDSSNRVNNVRAIASNGYVSTLAGYTPAGTYGGYGDGNGLVAQFSTPRGITIDSAGILFVADQGNNVIRKITSTGDVSTYAGVHSSTAYAGPYGVNPGTITWMNGQGGGSIDQNYIRVLGAGGSPSVTDPNVADTEVNRSIQNSVNMIRARTPNIPIIYCIMNSTTLIMILGSATPQVKTYDNGTPYPMDSYTDAYWTNGVVEPAGRYTLNLTNEWINYIVGGNDGPRGDTVFKSPSAITIDANDILYVSDGGNHKIRMITPSGNVTTIAGNGQASTASPVGSVDGVITTNIIKMPGNIAIDSTRRIVFAEMSGNYLRQISTTPCTPQIKAQY